MEGLNLVELVVVPLSAVAAALLGWVAKHVVAWLDAKTAWADGAMKDAVKARMLSAAELSVMAVEQTLVEKLKAAAQDGKLTADAAKQAAGAALNAATEILKAEGLELGKDITPKALEIAIEAAVARLKLDRLGVGEVVVGRA